MKQVTVEESIKRLINIVEIVDEDDLSELGFEYSNEEFQDDLSDIRDFIEQQFKTPTFDEVIRAWEEILDESDVKTGKKIRVKISKGSALIEVFAIWCSDIWATICEINENEIDFKLNINMNNLNAINLTIRYLQGKEKENEQSR